MTKHSNQDITVEWKSPSNLAIVKYWGKKATQQPLNPSISFSLKKAVTSTRIVAKRSEINGFTFTLDGIKKETFNTKIANLLSIAKPLLPFIDQYHLSIESSNTFPHSSGIASSASSMSALALCLMELQIRIDPKSNNNMNMQKASELARLGSGSASRSLFDGWALWGETTLIADSSDLYAVRLEDVHTNFKQIANAILIIEPGTKKVSSSEGHALMKNHPYGKARIEQANENTAQLLDVLKSGDWQHFFDIAENEALSLHALMMSSNPGYTLLHPNSLKVIEAVINARKVLKLPVGFSMDAGPNVHLLYPKYEEERVMPWIESEIRPLCHEQKILWDEVGNGPQNMTTIKTNYSL